jgi:hypothetical protein
MDKWYTNDNCLYCTKCGKPYTYIGDVPIEGFPKGQEPWCICSQEVPHSISFPDTYKQIG